MSLNYFGLKLIQFPSLIKVSVQYVSAKFISTVTSIGLKETNIIQLFIYLIKHICCDNVQSVCFISGYMCEVRHILLYTRTCIKLNEIRIFLPSMKKFTLTHEISVIL